jgi:hypothetical protein
VKTYIKYTKTSMENKFLSCVFTAALLSSCSSPVTMTNTSNAKFSDEVTSQNLVSKIANDKSDKIDQKNSEVYFQFLNSKFPNSWSARGLHVFSGHEFDFWRGELRSNIDVYELKNCTDEDFYCLKSDRMSLSVPKKCDKISNAGWKHKNNEMVVISHKNHNRTNNPIDRAAYVLYEKSHPDVIFSYKGRIDAIMSREFGSADLLKHFSQPNMDFDKALDSWRGSGTMISRSMSSETLGPCT